jgi:hypothetical protein
MFTAGAEEPAVCFETYEGIFYDILKKINKQHFS